MCLWHFIFYTSSGYSMNLLIGNKFNTIIINETNNFTMQIILQTKIQNLRLFIKSFIKRRKNSDKNHSISPPKNFVFQRNEKKQNFEKQKKKKRKPKGSKFHFQKNRARFVFHFLALETWSNQAESARSVIVQRLIDLLTRGSRVARPQWKDRSNASVDSAESSATM